MSFHFVLQRTGWGHDDLYDALKTGEKTSEWRDGSDHWKSRLLNEIGRTQLRWAHELKERNKGYTKPYFIFPFNEYMWKHKKARFVVGYTKRPMLLADVTAILYYSKTNQFEIRIENVEELVSEPCNRTDCNFNIKGEHCSTIPELSVGNACKTFRLR